MQSMSAAGVCVWGGGRGGIYVTIRSVKSVEAIAPHPNHHSCDDSATAPCSEWNRTVNRRYCWPLLCLIGPCRVDPAGASPIYPSRTSIHPSPSRSDPISIPTPSDPTSHTPSRRIPAALRRGHRGNLWGLPGFSLAAPQPLRQLRRDGRCDGLGHRAALL